MKPTHRLDDTYFARGLEKGRENTARRRAPDRKRTIQEERPFLSKRLEERRKEDRKVGRKDEEVVVVLVVVVVFLWFGRVRVVVVAAVVVVVVLPKGRLLFLYFRMIYLLKNLKNE